MNRLLFLVAALAFFLTAPPTSAANVIDGSRSSIDLEVEKTVDAGASHFSERKIAYKIVVLNDFDASEAATWVDVEDHVPSYADIVSVDTPHGASWDPHDNSWTIERIEIGERVELGIVLKFHSSKLALKNCASIVHADQEDHDSTPDNFNWVPAEDDESCADASQVDLELTKTVSDENPNKGDEIVYTITLTNSAYALSEAHDITVAEVLPAGFEVLNIDASRGTVDPTTLSWNVDYLDVDESATLEITVLANPDRSGSSLVTNGLYRLHDHPDGNAADPLYGLRLDELFGYASPVTFSFDHEESEVWMQVSGSTVTIYGRVFGGKDHGSSYDPDLSGYWDLFFEYDGAVSPASGDDDLISTAGSSSATGYITPEFWSHEFDAGERFDLAGYVDNGLSFSLGNESDGNGHRGFDGISGWGWLKHGQHGSLDHVSASDWLFTAELSHENSYKNCVQVWEADEVDVDSGYANGFTRGEDDDACAKVHVNDEIDLAILKESIGYDSDTGEAEYQVTVYNQNIGDATGIVVRDYLPADAAFTRVISTTQGSAVAISPTVIEWEVGSIPGGPVPTQDEFTGPSATIVFRALIGPTLSTLNIAEIWAADQIDIDSTPGNFFSAAGKASKMAISEDDDDSADVPVVDISIDKKINSFDPVTMLAEFELSVENNSQVTATDVVVRDLLPFDAVTELGSRTDLLDVPGPVNAFDWNVGSVAPGEGRSTIVFVKIGGSRETMNCAELNSMGVDGEGRTLIDADSNPGNFDPAVGPQEDDEVCVEKPLIDLALEKSVSGFDAATGFATYVVTVINQGTVPAGDVVVRDYLPADAFTVSGTASATQGSFDGLDWTVGTLPINGLAELTFSARIGASGETMNCAEVFSTDGMDFDSTPANFDGVTVAEDDEACARKPLIDISLTKVAVEPVMLNVGDTAVFKLTVTNDGPDDAESVLIKDHLPADLSFVSATPSQGAFTAASRTWLVGDLPAGSSATLLLGLKTLAEGTLTNCAEVKQASPMDRDSVPGNFVTAPREDDEDCASVWTSDPEIDLRLKKKVDKSNATVGSTVTYTLTVFNDGPVSATGVVVADYLPAGLSLTASRPEQGSVSGLTWNVGTVPSLASLSLELDVKVEAAGEFTNCIEVWDADQQDVDSTPANFDQGKAPAEDDEACVSIWTRDPRIDVRLKKTVSKANVSVHDVVTYAIVVTNDGPADASGVVVADYLPSGLQIVDSRTSLGSFSGTSWSVGYLSVGSSARLELDVQVKRAGEFTNCAEVWDASPADKDSTPGNFAYAEREDDESCVAIWAREVTGTNEITGFVFVDKNENLTFDSGDVGQGGALVQLWRDLNGNQEVDGYDTFVDDVVTAYDGSYGFWINETGKFALQVDASTLPVGANLLGGNSEDAHFVSYGSTDSGNNFPIVFMAPPVSDAMCYLVADNDGNGLDSPDVLTRITPDGAYEQVVGHTYTDHIESIAFNPWTGVLYAADDRRLGTLDRNTGQFTEIGEFGGGEGEAGWRPFLDIDGLSFDPLSGDLFASVRKVGEPDFLIRVNPATGAHIPFSAGVDYLVIKSPFGLNDVDDIAVDPVDGSLWAINNEDGDFSRLVKIDRTSGVVLDVKPLPVSNVEGLGFFGDGTLYGTGGEGLESIVVIDKHSLSVQVQLTIGTGGNRDYEAVDCLTNATNKLSVSVFNDVNQDGIMVAGDLGLAGISVELYRDLNGNGIADFGDRLIAVRPTGANGTVEFEAAANGAFVTRISEQTLPIGSQITVGGSTPSVFTGFGESTSGMVGLSLSAGTSTSVDETGDAPVSFALNAAYPNPFNPQTTIPFAMPESGTVRLAVYDLLGREIAVLADGLMSAGNHEVSFEAGDVPSGTYLVRMTAGNELRTMTVTLLK